MTVGEVAGTRSATQKEQSGTCSSAPASSAPSKSPAAARPDPPAHLAFAEGLGPRSQQPARMLEARLEDEPLSA